MIPLIPIIIVLVVWQWLWPHLRDWLACSLTPWIRSKLGDTLANAFGMVVSWIDNAYVGVHSAVKNVWAFIKKRVFRINTTYTKTSATTATGSIETIIQTDDGKFIRRIEEEELGWEDIPAKIRDEMIRQNNTAGTIDVKEAYMQKIQEKADQEGLVLEMTTAT